MKNKLELDLHEIQKARESGKTLREIAADHGVSISTIRRRLASKPPEDGEILDFGDGLPLVIYKDSKQLPLITEASVRLGSRLKIPEPEKFEDFAETYQNVVWVYASVYAIANSLARLPLRLYKRTAEEDIESEDTAASVNRVEVRDHPVLELLNRPNPDCSWEDLLEQIVVSLELGGDAYIEIVRGRVGDLEIPTELYHINPAHITIQAREDRKGIAGYVFNAVSESGQQQEYLFKPEDIIHIHYHNPLNYWYGQGSALAAARAILLEQYLQRFCQRFFENDATPRGVLMTEYEVTEEQAEAILRKWRQKYGGVDQSHKVAILPLGLKYERIGSDLSELSLSDLNENNRKKIMAAFGVNDAVLGITQDMPRDVYRTCMRVFYENTLMPKARRIANALTYKLLPQFANADQNYYFEFDFSDVTAEPYDVRLNRWVKLFAMGVATPNEIAADLLGVTHDVEGADTVYVDSRFVPIGEASQLQQPETNEVQEQAAKRLVPMLRDIVDKLQQLDGRLRQLETGTKPPGEEEV